MNSPNIPGGYILVSRKLIESEIWEKPPLYLKVWMYLLVRAQYKPYKDLERGELIVSIPELIEACSYKVGYRTEKPTKSQIFNILEWLRKSSEASDEGYSDETMIETTKTTRGMVVRVVNYNVYQDSKNYEQNEEQNGENSTNETITKRQADTINKNVKNDLRIKELSTTTATTAPAVENGFGNLIRTFEENLCMLSPIQIESLGHWFDDFKQDSEVFTVAIKIAADRNRKNFGFVEYLLKEWSQHKLTTLEQIESHERNKFDRQRPQQSRTYGRPAKVERVPEWFAKDKQGAAVEQAEPVDSDVDVKRRELAEKLENMRRQNA